MKVEEAIKTTGDQTRSRLATCTIRSETETAQEAGSPLDDELLDDIAGGWPSVCSSDFPTIQSRYAQVDSKIC